MEAYIQKWGNSLGLRIPIGLARQLHLQAGSPIHLEIRDNQIIIKAPKYDLNTLLENITPENQHNPIFFNDHAQGNEEW